MMKTYRLAKETRFAIYPFGPIFTLQEAEHWQEELRMAGKTVLVVNTQTS